METVLPMLIKEIENVSMQNGKGFCAHTASIATDALCSLLMSGEEYVTESLILNAKDILRSAEEVGNLTHASLAKHASVCTGVLSR
eukprot:15324929-Ditylum_brightwellii.AAC.1